MSIRSLLSIVHTYQHFVREIHIYSLSAELIYLFFIYRYYFFVTKTHTHFRLFMSPDLGNIHQNKIFGIIADMYRVAWSKDMPRALASIAMTKVWQFLLLPCGIAKYWSRSNDIAESRNVSSVSTNGWQLSRTNLIRWRSVMIRNDWWCRRFD